jgi:hypothetical protein
LGKVELKRKRRSGRANNFVANSTIMSAKIIKLPTNPRHPTVEDIKRLEDFKDYTDEEAVELLQTIKSLCEVLLSITTKQHKKQQSKVRLLSTKNSKTA